MSGTIFLLMSMLLLSLLLKDAINSSKIYSKGISPERLGKKISPYKISAKS